MTATMPAALNGLTMRPELVRLREQAIAVLSVDAGDLGPALAGEELIHLHHTQEIIALAVARRAAAFSASNEAERQGSNTATDWIRHQANMSVADALEFQVVGRHLEQMPRTAEALVDGRIGFGHMVHLARNAAFIDHSGTGTFDEGPLLPHAEVESVSRFRHTCLHARHAQDPDGSKNEHVDAVESRELNISASHDGLRWFNLRVDEAAAAMIQSVLEKLARRTSPDDHRTRARRLADAAVGLLLGPTVEREGGTVVGRNVQINVTCTLETLLNLPGAPGGELEYGLPITAATVGRLACEAAVTKILLNDKLFPIAVGHTRRTLTRRERRGLNVRDRRCRVHGCDAPASRCEGHHLDGWSRTHTTSLDRMILLCSRHHFLVHEGGWHLTTEEDGLVKLVPPYLRHLARGPGIASVT